MLVIIHGWSDDAKSFRDLGKMLLKEGVAKDVAHIRLGEYISMHDNVTFDDVVVAMETAWNKKNLPRDPRSVDVVVHSTGGLVIRDWMTRFTTPDHNPVYRLLMLAPANFGSPLAHKGASFIGRIVKGFKSDHPLETGTEILKGLELASPYSWELAFWDRFGFDRNLFVAASSCPPLKPLTASTSGQSWYGEGKVLATVLVGSSGYSGISAAANEAGTDGTVRVSTANLNPLCICMNFVADPQNPTIVELQPKGETAFARVPGENHSTIALKDKGPRSAGTLDLIKGALQVDDTTFADWKKKLDALTDAARSNGAAEKYTHGYQNTVVRLTDDNGQSIKDYFVEVFAKKRNGVVDDPVTARIQEDVFTTTHANCENSAYRSLHIDVAELEKTVTGKGLDLYISVSARPDLRRTKTVGYQTFGYNDIGSIKLTPQDQAKFFAPDRTVLVDIRIRRYQTDKVFSFLDLQA